MGKFHEHEKIPYSWKINVFNEVVADGFTYQFNLFKVIFNKKCRQGLIFNSEIYSDQFKQVYFVFYN